MLRRFGNAGQSLGNKLTGMYNNRRGLAMGAQNILGTAKSGIRLLGRANAFVNRLGVSSPAMNKFTSNMEQYGNPSIDFASEELANVV